MMVVDVGEDICRICRMTVDEVEPLYHPCNCAGSVAYVHQSCLQKWLKVYKKDSCEICGFKYQYLNVYREKDAQLNGPFGRIVVTIIAACSKLKIYLFAIMFYLIWFLILPWTTGLCGQSLFGQYSILNDITNVFSHPYKLNYILYNIFSGVVLGYLYIGLSVLVIFLSPCLCNMLVDYKQPSWLYDLREKVVNRFQTVFDKIIKNFRVRITIEDIVLKQQYFLSDSLLAQALSEAFDPLYHILPYNSPMCSYGENVYCLLKFLKCDERISKILKTAIFQSERYISVFQAKIFQLFLGIQKLEYPMFFTTFYINDYYEFQIIPNKTSLNDILWISSIECRKTRHAMGYRDFEFYYVMGLTTSDINIVDDYSSYSDSNDNIDDSNHDEATADNDLDDIMTRLFDFDYLLLNQIRSYNFFDRFFGYNNLRILITNVLKTFFVTIFFLEMSIVLPIRLMGIIISIFSPLINFISFWAYKNMKINNYAPSSILIGNSFIDGLILLTMFYTMIYFILWFTERLLKSFIYYNYAFVCSTIHSILKVYYILVILIISMPVLYGAAIAHLINFFIDDNYPRFASQFLKNDLLVVEWWLFGMILNICIVIIGSSINKLMRVGLNSIFFPTRKRLLVIIDEIINQNLRLTLLLLFERFFVNLFLLIIYIFFPIYASEYLVGKILLLNSFYLQPFESIIKHSLTKYNKIYVYLDGNLFILEFIYIFFISITYIYSIDASSRMIAVIRSIITTIANACDLSSYLLGNTNFIDGSYYMTYDGILMYNTANILSFKKEGFEPYESSKYMKLKVLIFYSLFFSTITIISTLYLTFSILCGKQLFLMLGYNNMPNYISYSFGTPFFHLIYFLYKNCPRLGIDHHLRPLRIKYIFSKKFLRFYLITGVIFPCVIGELFQYWMYIMLRYNLDGDMTTSVFRSWVYGAIFSNMLKALQIASPNLVLLTNSNRVYLHNVYALIGSRFDERFCLSIIRLIFKYFTAPYCLINSILYALYTEESTIRYVQYILCTISPTIVLILSVYYIFKLICHHIYGFYLLTNYSLIKIVLNKTQKHSDSKDVSIFVSRCQLISHKSFIEGSQDNIVHPSSYSQ